MAASRKDIFSKQLTEQIYSSCVFKFIVHICVRVIEMRNLDDIQSFQCAGNVILSIYIYEIIKCNKYFI